MKRKLLSVLLTFCLAFSLLPTAALAEEPADPVAQIGEKTYATLKAAFEEAKDGDTVTLLKDVETNNIEDTVEARIIINKAITLNLNDKTIKSPDNMGNNNTNFTALIVDADVIINATTGGINTGKSCNGASVCKTDHIPNLCHKLRAKGIPHTAHSHDNGIFRQLGSQ